MIAEDWTERRPDMTSTESERLTSLHGDVSLKSKFSSTLLRAYLSSRDKCR
jgi:hypothetical protein